MRNKIIKNEGYHPGNITTGQEILKHDNPPDNSRTVQRDKFLLYDCNEKPLVRKIGFK